MPTDAAYVTKPASAVLVTARGASASLARRASAGPARTAATWPHPTGQRCAQSLAGFATAGRSATAASLRLKSSRSAAVAGKYDGNCS
jgi:hypothetical protein